MNTRGDGNGETTTHPSETRNPQSSTVETAVETKDYRSSAGQLGEEQKNVQVVHQRRPTSGGVLADAAAAATNTLQSAQNAISGN
ncbi:hypothetical protein OWV82_013238 [Melia azedarach]|uniref:Uncharacterized protein n=1 Tax=Melia azedarach TaxID=155640 RepID=A0ACC1XUK7_MELAZ|nr:hypothetical protein OWV82_013238 [Melia azedarach]